MAQSRCSPRSPARKPRKWCVAGPAASSRASGLGVDFQRGYVKLIPMKISAREQEARRVKIERLLPTFEQHVAEAAGRPIDPLGSDAPLVLALARLSIAGVPKYRYGTQDKALCPKLWRDIADDVGVNHPSVTTIEVLIARLENRVRHMHDEAFEKVSA